MAMQLENKKGAGQHLAKMTLESEESVIECTRVDETVMSEPQVIDRYR
jgi:hypothetical protein